MFVDDWVYLPDERERYEYVLNEQGIIYTGTSRYLRPMFWDFGQVSVRVVMDLFFLDLTSASGLGFATCCQ